MIESKTYEAEKNDPAFAFLDWLINVKVLAEKLVSDHHKLAIAKDGWIHRSNGAMVKSVRMQIDDGAYLTIKKGSTIILKHTRKLEDMPHCPDFSKAYDGGIKYSGVVECAHSEKDWPQALAAVIQNTGGCFNPVFFCSLVCGFYGSIHYSGPESPILFAGSLIEAEVQQKGLLAPIRM